MDFNMQTLWCFLGFALAVSSAMELSIDISDAVVSELDDVTVQCRVQDYQAGAVLNWWKKQGDEEVQMGSSNMLNELFRTRYSVEVQQAESTVIFFLNIRGVRVEDSGQFGCSLASVEGSKTYIALAVITSVKEIKLFAMRSNNTHEEATREYADGEEILFLENDEYYFRCLASGSNPPPDMQVTLGYGDEQQSLNDRFVREDADVVDDASGQVGMRRVTYTTVMTTTQAIRVTKHANSQELRCSASVSSMTEPLSIHVKPVLKFPPSITCPKSVKEPAYIDDFTLECEVVADPPVTEATWTWVYDDGSNTTLRINQKFGHYSFKMHDGEKPDTKMATLSMVRLYPQMFRRYVLVVKNERGQDKAIVTLTRDKGREPQESGAPSVTSAVLLNVVCLLLVTLGLSS